MWAALVRGMPALAGLRLVSLDAEKAVLAPRAGQRGAGTLLTDARRQRAGQVLEELTGRKLRIEVSAEPASADGGGARGTAPSPRPDAGEAKAAAWRAARELPLVQQVQEMFPEAVIVEVIDEADEPVVGRGAADTADGAASDDDADADAG